METRSRLKKMAQNLQEKEVSKGEKFQEIILFFFALLSLTHILLELVESDFCLYSKALLMPVLMIYTVQDGIDMLFLPALIFAWIGDIFLFFDTVEINFIMGLGSFLMMQLFYMISFNRLPDAKSSYFTLYPSSKVAIIVLYATLYIGINYIIADTAIKGNMQVPVLVYSLAICFMSISALNSSSKNKYVGFNLFMGTLFFIISDGIIALTKFKIIKLEKVIAQMLIMSTYCLAQAIIVHAYTQMTKSVIAPKKVK